MGKTGTVHAYQGKRKPRNIQVCAEKLYAYQKRAKVSLGIKREESEMKRGKACCADAPKPVFVISAA